MYMDLTYDPEQNDSGMESLTASKDDTPERRPEDSFITPVLGTSPSALTPVSAGPLKEYDDEPDETLSERLWGLSEMFPDRVRSGTYTLTTKTWSGVKSLYGLSRSVMWILASSSVILFAPVIFEVERAQVEEMQKSQQKQVLLGTNTALSGPMPNMPPMPR
ncbi:PREDICTED: mitochondrial import receptor subunit TOM22 homolog isoform X1 [Papilio polytes]|uniref:mitochondrial import receptor subunit TOM22 homolog isoform X1 n=1 Tax=Papilio polytes TaxID=76194 RepID=UPI00067645AB|nr:PREDICTED: mitochondrial import receptor subunit TOM22 homolog isoform X1 [Papilio polytes]